VMVITTMMLIMMMITSRPHPSSYPQVVTNVWPGRWARTRRRSRTLPRPTCRRRTPGRPASAPPSDKPGRCDTGPRDVMAPVARLWGLGAMRC
jgi:hypothetical protein